MLNTKREKNILSKIDSVCRNKADNALWWRAVKGQETNGRGLVNQAVTGRVLTAGGKSTRDIIFIITEVCLVRVTWHDLGWFLISRVPVCLPLCCAEIRVQF